MKVFMLRSFLITIWLCFLSGSVSGNIPNVVNVENKPELSLADTIEMLPDPERTLTISDVLNLRTDFSPVNIYPAMGFTRQVFWFRIPLSRELSAPEKWVFKVSPTYLDHVTLWQVSGGELLPSVKKIGRRDSHSNGYILDQALQTSISIPEGLSWLYIRVQSGTTLALIPKLLQPDTFIQQGNQNSFSFGIIAGVMVIIILFNLVAWWITRISLYGLFGGYILFGLVSLLDATGTFDETFIYRSLFSGMRPLCFYIGLTWFFAFRFFQGLLLDEKKDWWLLRLYQCLYLSSGAAFISGFSGGYAYSYVAEALTFFGGVSVVLTVVPALRAIIYGGSGGEKLLGWAFLPQSFFLGLNQVYAAGLMPASMLNVLGQTQGGVFQIVLLQVALLYRVRDLLQEHKQVLAEAERVNAEVEKERSIREEQSRFLSMITHEIRTPLAVIDMSIQSLKVLDNSKDASRESRYSRIQSSVKRMATLLELGLKKDGFSSEIWQPDSALSLRDVSRKVMQELPVDQQPLIDQKYDDVIPLIKGNLAALKMTFFNLVENALKYSGGDERVLITVGKTDNTVFWQVEDRGQGVPEEQWDRIFDKFFRTAETSGKPGLGLGLYIAKQIMERHDGQITCSQSRWGGACFRCSFPRGE